MAKPLKILFLSQYFPPEMGAPSARTHELSRHWVELGQDIKVITGFPHHPTGIISPEYKQHFLKTEKIDGIKVIRTYVYPTANKGFIKRILSYISFMFSSIILGSWKTGHVDIVIATSPHFFVAIAGYIISRLKGKPFVFEVRDLWPESIIQLGQIRNQYIIKALEAIESFLYKRAHLIISVTNSFVPIIVEKGVSDNKIRIVTNGVDLTLFSPHKYDTALKKRLELDDKFIVSYIGTHGLSHALDKVIETAYLMRNMKNVHFLLIGEGAEKENLIKQRENLSLKNVTFLSQIEKQALPYYYSLCHIVLITLRDLEIFRTVLPSKMFEIMAMAKPIILSVDGEARELVVEKARAGIFVEPENSDALNKAISYLYENRKLRQELGENGRRFVEKNYSRKAKADTYLSFLQELQISLHL